jgi:hypothetical protein
VAGLQTQYAPTGYIGLWSRMRDFRRELLTAALEDRRVIQATLMRSTIHLVSAADYWPLAHAVRLPQRAWWRRVAGTQLAELDADAFAVAVRDVLANGPMRQAELAARLADAGFPARPSGLNILVNLVRVPPSGTWERRRADLYGLAAAWLPPEPPFDEAAGVDRLVRRYLGGFGPASERDIARFGGIELGSVRAALERIAHRRLDHAGTILVDLPGAPLPDEETPAPVRFLGTWEALLLVHARRTAVLPEGLRPRVFNTKTPHSIATFLVDGEVRGSWRIERGRIVVEPFARLAPRERRAVDAEAERLAAFVAD